MAASFPPQAFPTTISSFTSPPSVSHSQQQPSPCYCSTVPKLQLQAAVLSRGPMSLSKVCMAAARTVILIPFRLPQISSLILILKCFSSNSDSCPDVGIGPLLQFPHPQRIGPVLITLLFFALVPSSSWVCVVLCIPFLCSCIPFLCSGTPVLFQLGFCMHFCVWRCVPNVSVGRDVLHIHLLLCHLVLSSHH